MNLPHLLSHLKAWLLRGRDGGGSREAPYTKPQIGGRNWKRSRNEFARAMRDVSMSLRRIRHASHVRTAQDHAADAACGVALALSAVNELVSIAEQYADD